MTVQEALEVIDKKTIPKNDGFFYEVAEAKEIIKNEINKLDKVIKTLKVNDDKENDDVKENNDVKENLDNFKKAYKISLTDHNYYNYTEEYIKHLTDFIFNGSKDAIPNCCKHCSNHPYNGGSGICNCVAPMLEMPFHWG